MYHFPDIDRMPDHPALPVPDYQALAEGFRGALISPGSHILRYDGKGCPIFGAYVNSMSNEMVTWGILAVGEWLSGRDTAWIGVTYPGFFMQETGLYMNSPGSMTSEYWYLFYVHALAGAVMCALFPEDKAARGRMASSADALVKMARHIHYGFNGQGFRFGSYAPFTFQDEYRQPDSIAGYAYQMLFAALKADRPEYLQESKQALEKYQRFTGNPWYEIPNGSAGLMAAAWLSSHGHEMDMEKIAGWVFDHAQGPLQAGKWGDEEVDGLMMGWRGDTRQAAMDSAYSMETLMPLQFLLPSVRYCPGLADAVGKWARCVLSNFPLFYGRGTVPLYETRPDLTPDIPYERLVRQLDGHTPAACGDFAGHRSVYGAGYLSWLAALARPTTDADIFALDLSLTDWLAGDKYPVFLLRNASGRDKAAAFAPAGVWQKLKPELYGEQGLSCVCWSLRAGQSPENAQGEVRAMVPAKGLTVIALLPRGIVPEAVNGFWTAGAAELLRLDPSGQ